VSIDVELNQGILLVRLQGDLDHHGVERIRDEIEQELQNNGYRGIVLSFTNLDFMDSSGLGLILGRYKSVTQHGGKMALANVNPALKRLFELSGILKIVAVCDSEEQALQLVREAN